MSVVSANLSFTLLSTEIKPIPAVTKTSLQGKFKTFVSPKKYMSQKAIRVPLYQLSQSSPRLSRPKSPRILQGLSKQIQRANLAELSKKQDSLRKRGREETSELPEKKKLKTSRDTENAANFAVEY